MPGKNKSVLLIVIASFLFILLSVLLLLLILNPDFKEQQYQQIISSYTYVADNPVKSYGTIRKALFYASDFYQWKEVLFLAFELSENSDDWSYFKNIAKKGLRVYPGHEIFRASYTAALMWDGDIEEAKRVSRKLLSSEFEGIISELFLIEESLRIDPDIEPYQGVINNLKDIRDPEYYEHIARIVDNPPLQVDAAMLWMLEGEISRAYNLVKDISHFGVPDQIPGYICYDYGDIERAQSYLTTQMLVDHSNHNERWTLNVLLGDIAFILGQYDSAENYYLRSLEIHEQQHWRPLLNLSILYHKLEVYKISLDYMEKALTLHNQESSVIGHFVAQWRDEYPVVSERLINRYLVDHPEDLSMSLNNTLYFPNSMTPSEYSAYLWELFNKNSGNKDVAKFLVWYLASSEDYSGAELVIQRYKRLNMDNQWTFIYEAIINALKSGVVLNESIELLEKSLHYNNDWYIYYNLAVIYLKLGQYPEALTHINEAEHFWQVQQFEPSDVISSKIFGLYSIIYKYSGNEDLSLDYARKSLELDPYNNQVRSIIMELN